MSGETLANLKRLLKEYIARIEQIGDRVAGYGMIFESGEREATTLLGVRLWGGLNREWLPSEVDRLADAFRRIKPLAEDLDRYASQLIEHGGLEDLDDWELRLRLTEIEVALDTTSHRLDQVLRAVKPARA